MPRLLAPKSVGSQVTPVFTLFRLRQGEYLLRTFTAGDTFLATELAKALTDKRLLTVITPTDTKVFSFDPGEEVIGEGDKGDPIANGQPDAEPPDPMEEASRLAAEGEQEVKDSGPIPVRRKHRKKEAVTPNSVCGRCGGNGKVAQLMEGGQATEGVCPVCQGSGGIVRYGGGRR